MNAQAEFCEESRMCDLCPTTEDEQGAPLKWVEWMRGYVCKACEELWCAEGEDE